MSYVNAEDERIMKALAARVNTVKKKEVERLASFGTGAVRDNEKDIYALTLISPIALKRLAITSKEGEKAYGPYNWEKGMPVRDLLEHVLGHILDFLSGETDPATFEDHLAHGTWGMIGAMHSQVMWPHLNEGTLRLPGCIAPLSQDTAAERMLNDLTERCSSPLPKEVSAINENIPS